MINERLGRDRAKAQLNLCLDEGQFVATRHFKDELKNDGLDMEDAFIVCRSGAILDEPEENMKSGQWRYRITGNTTDGKRVAVVFALNPGGTAVFITVFID